MVNPFINLEILTEGHLQSLINDGATETSVLDFKREPYSGNDEGAKELLKDMTAFANTAGGVLLIGMSDIAGVASEVVPLSLEQVDKLEQRIISLLLTGVQPRIHGVQTRRISVMGGSVLAIKVPHSASAPHRVLVRGTNRYYLRQSSQNIEASHEQLRNSFVIANQWMGRMEAFRTDRLRAILEGEGPVSPGEGFVLAVHIVPLNSNIFGSIVDLKAARQIDGKFRPMGAMGYSPSINAQGFLVRADFSYTQLFREGIIESVMWRAPYVTSGKRFIGAHDIVRLIIEVTPGYISGLQALGVNPPFLVAISFWGIKGAYVNLSRDPHTLVAPNELRNDELLLPVIVIEDFGVEGDYIEALRPSFDAFWNAGGSERWTGSA